MRAFSVLIYLLIGIGAAMTMDSKALEAMPNDRGFRIFSAVLSTLGWPIYVGARLVEESTCTDPHLMTK
jgi:hypothetical protein